MNIEVGRGFALFYNLIDKYCKLLWRQKGTDVTDLQRSPIFTLLFTALPVLAPLLQFEKPAVLGELDQMFIRSAALSISSAP